MTDHRVDVHKTKKQVYTMYSSLPLTKNASQIPYMHTVHTVYSTCRGPGSKTQAVLQSGKTHDSHTVHRTTWETYRDGGKSGNSGPGADRGRSWPAGHSSDLNTRALNKNQTEGKAKVVAASWGTELNATQPIILRMIRSKG